MSPARQIWEELIGDALNVADTFVRHPVSTEEDKSVVQAAVQLLHNHRRDIEILAGMSERGETVSPDALYILTANVLMATSMLYAKFGSSNSSSRLKDVNQAAKARSAKAPSAQKNLQIQKEVLSRHIADWEWAAAHPHKTAEAILEAVNRDLILAKYGKTITSRQLQSWIKMHAKANRG
ncbi:MULTISPECIES: hypothetical protein [unclassified Methylobacterium]|uniref:hypothetical protein n=1 Tax=unclassified Methylobacterium TaxID=2615210 RepID=UPI00226AD876|nr:MULTISPECIES: hypothetical protein [unclassified Methylobacterium]